MLICLKVDVFMGSRDEMLMGLGVNGFMSLEVYDKWAHIRI
jgi:hypothetical protein